MEKNDTGENKEETTGKKRFVYIDGLRFEQTSYGLVYSPEYQTENRKHDCADCMTCAWCSDPRCALCRNEKKRSPKKEDATSSKK